MFELGVLGEFLGLGRFMPDSQDAILCAPQRCLLGVLVIHPREFPSRYFRPDPQSCIHLPIIEARFSIYVYARARTCTRALTCAHTHT